MPPAGAPSGGAWADTSYSPGGSVLTQTSGGFGVPSAFAEMMARKQAQEEADREMLRRLQAAQLRAMTFGLNEARRASMGPRDFQAAHQVGETLGGGGETVYGKYVTVAGQTYLQEVPAGTPGAHPIATLPPGQRASQLPQSAAMVGDVNAPSPAGLSPAPPPGPEPEEGPGQSFERERLRNALARSDAEYSQRQYEGRARGRTPPRAPKPRAPQAR